MKSVNFKKTRKLNTFYLENRHNINLSATSIQQYSTATNVLTSVNNDQSKSVVLQNENVHSYRSQGNENTPLQFSPSYINVRTPLSNITNANIGFNNYPTSTLANKRNYSVLSDDMTSRIASTIFQSSSSIKLNPGCHKLKRKSKHLSPIPLIDLTADVENIHEVIYENLIVGISKEYLDHGDQFVVCQTCRAKLWTNESIRGKQKRNTDFSLCCGYGKVQLPDLKKAPPTYERMFQSNDSKSKNFMKNIRRYNSMFSFTSMGGKIDSSINRGNAPYIFRLGDQNYHSIESLLPAKGSQPKFSQLYIYDTENENSNRQRCFGENHPSTSFDNDIIEDLKVMLDSNNVLVSSYRMVRDAFQRNPHVDMKLRIIGQRNRDGRTYNLPTASEVAALIVGDISDSIENRDIVVQTKSGFLQRISELHPSYLPLQYPLLFPYGDDGYSFDILHRGNNMFLDASLMRIYVTKKLKELQGYSIKYLFKYINKGPDRATVAVVRSNNDCDNHEAVDEINEYYDCRYLSACEASWRIFKYDVHYRYPSIVRLPFHLPGQQQIVYGEDDDIDDVLDKHFVAASMFTTWMKCNAISCDARKLTYVEFPTKFVLES
ncbi:unnamed protein product [Lactuca virosa]|uniref:Helitron helicase-like domain-containing protein n=1 Tax=Lactuca virosa TaxID=75947 RepID=A0AAU9PCS1_9ASTR|nr:unnamed protein product [Lactuca virosa]